MAAPKALTPEQIAQIVAAGRGSSVNIDGLFYGGNWADQGSGESMQEGPLQNITASTGKGAGNPYYEYNPTGAFTREGVEQKVDSGFGEFLLGAGALFALPGALNGSLFGTGTGTGAGAGLTTSEMAAADMALGGAGGTAGAEALASAAAAGGTTLTASQIANLAKAGINVAGLMGATNAISNMGNATTTPAGTALPTQAAPEYTADYFAKLQGAYNQALPGMPRDVVSNLADWYGGSTGGMMSGGTTAPTTQAPISNGITRTPANLVAPMTSLMNAYRSGNVADTKQALMGALDAGMSTEQLMKTFNLGMQDIDYLRGQGYYLPAMTNEIKDVIAQELQNPATAYQNIVAKMDATGTNPAAVAQALGLSTEEVQNAYNQLNPSGLFSTANPDYGAVNAGYLYNLADNPTDYQTAIQEVQKYRAADEVGQQSVVEKALAAELAARPGASLSALQQMAANYGVSAQDVAAAYSKLGYV